ncbi:MAG: hypothetical protein R6W77_13235 [Trueperaceae bacterium]
MRSRLLDVVLIVGLVAVAGGIMWTLFNLGSSPRTDAPTPSAVSPAPSTPAGSQVTPVDPAGPQANAGDPDVAALPPTPPANDGGAAPDDATAGTPAAAAPPPEPRVVPEGSVALERIGFSYVTGGPGACGVVLEAWVHVAVSRDLLAAYGCGTEVLVTLDDPAGGRSEVVGVIGDTMNPSFERTVNVYVGEDEDAFAYGLTTGVFAAR